jgi:hypothetical protein
VFSSLARGPAVSWTTAPEFRAEIVARDFQMPVSIAFVPNPRPEPTAPLYYVAELYGQVKVVRRDGVVSTFASGLVNFNPTGNFPGSGEQGIGCLVVDPSNGDVFSTSEMVSRTVMIIFVALAPTRSTMTFSLFVAVSPSSMLTQRSSPASSSKSQSRSSAHSKSGEHSLGVATNGQGANQ